MALIFTERGMLEEGTLEYAEGTTSNAHEFVYWREWRLNGELVKRSAHVILKQPAVVADAIAASVG